jgi:predicted RecA/RadA family phage recombinase
LNVLDKHIQEIMALATKDGSPDLIQRASNADNDFKNLRSLINKRMSMVGAVLVQNSVDWWNYVVTRPMALSHEAAELQRMLSALGITREQLQGQTIARNIADPNPPPSVRDWSMWEFLQAAQDFPKLWIKEADAKRDAATASRIARSVRELRDVFDAPLNPRSPSHCKTIEEVCEDLGLLTEECCDEGRMIMARLTRFTKLGVTILAPLAAPLSGAPTTPPPAPPQSKGAATNPRRPPSVFGPHYPTFPGRPEETQPVSIIYPRMPGQPRPAEGTGILIGNLFGVVAEEQPDEHELLYVYTQGVFCLQKQDEEAVCVGIGLYWDDQSKSVTQDGSNKKSFIGVSTRGAAAQYENIIVHLQTGPCQIESDETAQLSVEGDGSVQLQ